ncbi:hypothetical protein KVV02_000516 [Mortierella alpina]|uniref:K Homology domain-containing protein n=1 Tax=Mortierella alpina TaxID=64518 RepID=A0A9P8A617_MORAP|nr:hypothetical protein KVV02_000516 [Mortierella alpina]
MAENTILSLCLPSPTPAQAGPVDEATTHSFQQLCMDIGRSHHCQVVLDVSLNSTPAKKRLSIETHQSVYNVTISGAYQNVMLTRGALIRNSPLKPKLSIKISKASITANPFPDAGTAAASRPSTAPPPPAPASIAGSTAETSTADSRTPSQTTASPATEHAHPSNTQAAHDSATEANTRAASDPTQTLASDASACPSASPDASSAPAASASFSSYITVLPQFKSQVDQISASTKTTISLLSSQFHALPSAKSVVAAHARQETVELLVSGTWENAEAARLLLLAAIDTLRPGTVQDTLQVELKYQNMIGGRKRQAIQELMAKTRTSIYLASPFVQTANKSGCPVDPRNNEIHITGEHGDVKAVKEALTRSYTRAQTAAPTCTRQVNIASRKLDWMLLNHRDRLRAIMIDNASFIAFPPLGASHPIIFVYGESRVNVERTIRTVMQLSSQFHSGSINLLSPVRENLVAIPPTPPSALSPVANISKLVSQASGAEVEFRNNGFYIFGNEIQTRIAVQYLSDIDFIKTLHYEVKFSVELANEHREFISGKKNGKINRIMKTTGAKIKFDPCNEYNFYVDLSSPIAVKAVEALALLQEELPAEISFYVPETYHKRIIGVGGKNIQRIMKKFGVYVKFSNSEEFANLGGYFDNLDNVVARTPSKNSMNLDNLKHAVMELVNPKDKDFVHHSLSIPKHYHISLLADHAKALSELQEATNATIRFPEKETGSDTVWISGPESLIQQATSMLLSMVDEQYVYPVPFSEAMDRVLAKPDFNTEVRDKMKNEWNMTLVPPPPREVAPTAHESGSATGTESNASKLVSPSVTPAQAPVDRQGADRQDRDGENGLEQDDEKLAKSLSSLTDSDDESNDSEEEDHVFIFKYSRNNEDYLQNAKELLVQYLINNQIEVYDDEIRIQRPRSDSFAEAFPHFNSKILSSVTGGESSASAPAPAFLNYSLFDNAGNAFDTLNRAPGSSIGGPSAAIPGTGSMVASDIRALFSHGVSPGLPPLATSPPRWPEQHSRELTSVPASSSGVHAVTAASGPSFASGQAPISQQHSNQSSPYNRLTPLPIDPWASPAKQQQQQQHPPISAGYPGSMSQFRTPPPGISPGVSVAGSGSGYYPSGGHGQQAHQVFSPEGPYGFQKPGSTPSSHLYSSSSSPVQGPSSNLGNFQHQQQLHHPPSPQRAIGSSGSRDNLQFYEDKMMAGTAFGQGYGPALNSGNARAQQQQQQQQIIYQQQQQLQHQHQHQQQANQAYPSSPFGQSMQYPQQRQRHSSHNSATSHHTMFLGAIGGGLGSTGGSVNSDDISTEDESDEPYDDLTLRYRSYHTQFQQQPYPGGNTGFAPHAPGSSAMANRRGSVPSMGSMYSNQQLYQSGSSQHSVTPPPNVVRLSNSSSDLYGRKSLVSAMARHSIGQQQQQQHQQHDSTFSSGRSLGGLGGSLSGMPGDSDGRGSSLNMPNLSTGSAFGNERDLFSSGLGGIIGGGTISHSGSFNTHTQPNFHNQANGGGGGGGYAGNSKDGGTANDGRGSGFLNSTLSSSALPYLAEAPQDRPGHHVIGDWDR